MAAFYDFTSCTPTISNCDMHDSSDNGLVRSSIPIQASHLEFGSYSNDWAPNNVPASVYLTCTNGAQSVNTNAFSWAK